MARQDKYAAHSGNIVMGTGPTPASEKPLLRFCSGIRVPRQEVIRLLGRGSLPLSPGLERLLDGALDEGGALLSPRGLCSVRVAAAPELVPADDVLVTGPEPEGWQGVEEIAFAIGTIGPELEQRVGQLFGQGLMAKAHILDAFGSAAVESLAREVERMVRNYAEESGTNVGPRFAPGHGRWSIQWQTAVFNAVPAQQIGVRLSESCMMIPEKSFSFCFGLGRKVKPTVPRDNCRSCSARDCAYRRRGNNS